jgi:hypothetical protein
MASKNKTIIEVNSKLNLTNWYLIVAFNVLVVTLIIQMVG